MFYRSCKVVCDAKLSLELNCIVLNVNTKVPQKKTM